MTSFSAYLLWVHRKAGLCKLVLYLPPGINYRSFLVFWWYYGDPLPIISCHLHTGIFSLFSYLYFLNSACVSRITLKGSRWSGQPCLISDFNEVASNFSSFRKMLIVGLSRTAFIILRYAPSSPTFPRTFIMSMFNFVKGLVYLNLGNHVNFCLQVHLYSTLPLLTYICGTFLHL